MTKTRKSGKAATATATRTASPVVHLDLGARSYDIVVRRGALATIGEEAARACCDGNANGRTAVIVTNPKVDLYHGKTVAASLEAAGFRVVRVSLTAGECYKTLQTVRRLYKTFHDEQLDRRALVVALGGGVIGDVAGFAAATYNRGLDLVQVPTTLLAQVDSSVGGKTGVNFGATKNLIGAFYQPRLVVIDPNTLSSLPIRERRSGLAEIIKYGIIYDKSFFQMLQAEVNGILRLTSPKLEYAVSRSCEIKARIVEQDERDEGLRAILNFGHTIGHALEAITHYRVYRHGEAIAVGMVSAALIGEQVGITKPEDTLELISIFSDAGFPVHLPEGIAVGGVLRLLAWDKKSVDGTARFVLLEEIGRVTPGHDVPPDAIREALARQQNL